MEVKCWLVSVWLAAEVLGSVRGSVGLECLSVVAEREWQSGLQETLKRASISGGPSEGFQEGARKTGDDDCLIALRGV